MIEEGTKAPGFTLPDQDGREVSLADFAGRTLYGKKSWGVQRSTYIIDGDGTVAKVFPKVSPKTHDDVVLDALA